MNKKVGLGVFLLIILLLASPLFAESFSLGVKTLTISGKVDSKSIFEVNQVLGPGQGSVSDAIPLDSGAILEDSGVIGVEVGEWSVDSNSSATLKLLVSYGNFVFGDVEIPYVVNNGTDDVESGETFFDLVRVGGIYSPDVNNGNIYIRRTDNNSYPPSNQYVTTIHFTVSTE